MSQPNLCRLCVNICNAYKSLYDDNDQRNKVYEITTKYFHPMFLNVEQGSHLTVICLECWKHISDFYNFQKSVFLAQTKLLEDDKQEEFIGNPPTECPSISEMCKSTRANVGDICAEITNANRENVTSVETNEIADKVNAVKVEDDSNSMPDLEWLDDMFGDVDNKPDIGILVKTETTQETSMSDVISVISSLDDTDSEEFEEPVGIFVGGDFDCNDSKPNTSLGQQQSMSVQNCSVDNDASSECLAKTNVPGTGAKTESVNTIVEKSNNESSTNDIATTNVATQDSTTPLHHDNNQPMTLSQNGQKKRKSLQDIIAQWRPTLMCKLCSDSCSSFELLQEHFRREHCHETCYIECCECKLYNRLQIEEHIRLCLRHNDTETAQDNSKRRKTNELDYTVAQHPNSAGDISEVEEDASPTNGDDKLKKMCKNKRKRRTLQELEDIISQWRPNLLCVVCNKSCPTFALLQAHFHQQHPYEECHILCCQRRLKQRNQIEEHIRYHKNADIFKCKLCGKQHMSGGQLNSHLYYQHPAAKKEVPQSDGNVSSNNDTDSGQLTKTSNGRRRRTTSNPENNRAQWESNLECVVCHKMHSDFMLLQEHFRQEHPSEECQILSCRFKLTRQQKTDDHQQSDSLQNTTTTSTSVRSRKSCRELDTFIAHYEPNLKCVLCSESCSSFTLLKLHFQQTHPLEECHVLCCQRKFTLRSAIAEHISLHIDSNIFKCDFCGKCHVSKNQLLSHIQQQHSSHDGEQKSQMTEKKTVVRTTFQEIDDFIAQCRPYLVCALCKAQRSSFTLLNDHFIEEHHNQDCHIVCCDLKLQTRHEIEEHLLFHNDPNAFKCALCDESCSSRVSLYNHKRSQHSIATNSGGGNASCNNDPIYGRARKTAKKKMMRKTRLINKRLDKSIAQWKPHLECAVCHDVCSTYTLLENHFRQSHPHEEIYVLCCQQQWKQRNPIVEHIRQCHGHKMSKNNRKTRRKRKELDGFISQYERDLECVECGKTCANFTELKIHFRLEHPNKECHILCCERKLVGRFQIVEHIRLHVDPNAFKCELCDHSCTGVASLRSHMAQRHGKSQGKNTQDADSRTRKSPPEVTDELDVFIAQWRPNLECVMCSESCSSFRLLHQHFRLQHPYEECHIVCCRRKLKTRQQIEEHIRFHKDPNAFKCAKCNKQHLNKANLKSHMRYRHAPLTEDDPYYDRARRKSLSKPNGRKTFKEFDDIIARWKPKLECVVCNESFTSFTLLRKHFTQKHPDHQCHILCCGRKFNRRYQIEEHIRVHIDPSAFKCDLCDKCCTSRALLYNHMVTKHPEKDISFSNVGYLASDSQLAAREIIKNET